MRDAENIRGSPRLLFTKEELETPELEKPIAKVQKAQKKYDSARKKVAKHRHSTAENPIGAPADNKPVLSSDVQFDTHPQENPGNQFFHRETKQTEQRAQRSSAPDAGRKNGRINDASKMAGRKVSFEARAKSAPEAVGSMAKQAKTAKNAIPDATAAATGAPVSKTSRLVFEEIAQKRPPKIKHPSNVVRTINTEIHRNAAKANQDDNVAATASMKAEEKAESALRMGDHVYHAHKLKPYRQMEKAQKELDKANISYLQASKQRENPTFTSNPYSRWQQKRAIRKEYAEAKKAGKSAASAHDKAKRAQEAASELKEKIRVAVNTIRRRPKLMILGLLGGMLVMVMGMVQSCTPLAQSILESVVIGTYPATEDDVRAAERAYLAKEQELKYEMDHYKDVHPGYDEYHVEQDEIWHNPYVLIAIISAYYDGQEWDMDKAMPVINKYFKLQYRVTEEVVTETRYRTEQQSGTRWVTDPDTGQQRLESYTYDEDVPYEYTICNVTLENYDLSHTPVISMSHHTMGMYALYMATHGNMEGIFHGKYAVPLKDPYIYDIPQETLDADPNFAKLMEEANKYVGYPYVWGGASPETSFDCSGFVSYVYTASGVYNIGRRGANGLHSMCRTVTPEEVRPGDLVFFEGTMGEKVGGITHVGIYVGNHHMIHCGSPCGSADLNDHYWVQHFHSYGRVPY